MTIRAYVRKWLGIDDLASSAQIKVVFLKMGEQHADTKQRLEQLAQLVQRPAMPNSVRIGSIMDWDMAQMVALEELNQEDPKKGN